MASPEEISPIKALEPIVKQPFGRPPKYDPSFCEMVVEFGKMGMSMAEIANAFDVTRETVHEWAKKYPDFSDALSRARHASLAWWEDKARSGLLMGSQFNASLYAKAMSGRFPDEPYRERVQVSGPNDGPIEVADARKSIEEKLAKLSERMKE